MNNLLNKASIVLTPTAYSDGSLNTVIPPYQVFDERVVNGDFSDGTNNWQGNVNTTLSVSNGQLDIQSGGGSGIYGVAFTEVNFVEGKKYLIKLDVISTNKPTQIRVGTSSALTTGSPTNIYKSGDIGIGGHEIIYTSTGNFTYLAIGGRNDITTLVIDNVSVKEVQEADFDFSRGSSATRVNEQGLVEDVQILSGELVQNGDFSQQGSELVVNGTFLTDTTTGWNDWSNITNPNNSSQQDGYGVLDATTGAADARQEPTVTPNKIYKIEATLKEDAGANGRLYMSDGANYNYAFGNFDATTTETTFVKYVVPTQTVIRLYAYTTGSAKAYFKNISVKEVGQSWSLNDGAFFTANGVNLKHTPSAGILTSDGYTALVVGRKYRMTYEIVENNAGAVKLGSATDEPMVSTVGTHTKEFIADLADVRIIRDGATVDVTIDNISVIEVTDDTDLPRIDFTDGTGSLLLEPQRTNLVTYSEDFNAYRVAGSTVTPNSTTAPDGTNSGILVTQGVSTLVLRVPNVVAPSTIYTFSGYFKSSGSVTQVKLDITDENITAFDLTNEWQRFSVTAQSKAGGSPYHFVDVDTNGSQGDTFYAWGLQVEQGDYATSYIPTSGSTVTRSADVANNSGNADLFNDSEGVLYAETAALANDGTNRWAAAISNGTNFERVQIIYLSADNTISASVINNNTSQCSFSYSSVVATDFNKIAISYKQNDFKMYVNGTQVDSDTSGNAPSGLDTLGFERPTGVSQFYGKVKQLIVFKEALTDSELACLTSQS